MNTQPPHRGDRVTWVDRESRYWRVQRLAFERWSLSLWSPATNMWTWVDDFSTRSAAIDAAVEEPPAGSRP